MRDISHSPLFRNALHAAVFLIFGLPLMFIAQQHWVDHFEYYAAAFMGLVTLVNLTIMPRSHWGKVLKREEEGAINGLWLYPLALGACFLTFPLYAVFAAWAVLAFGDAAASLFGRTLPRVKLFWNKKKSLGGLAAFVLFAGIGAYFSLWLMPCPLFLKSSGSPELPYVWTLAVLGAAAGALAESLDVEVNDNVRIPFAAASIMVLAAYFLNYSTRSLPATTHVQPEVLIHALIANAILGAAVLLLGLASLGGTLLGIMLGVVIYFYAQWQGYLLFVLFVGVGCGLSRVGWKRKQENMTAEANEGRRGIANVAANLLVPALCCGLYPLSGGHSSLLLAFAGALSAALADTASSEIGTLSRRQPVLITTFKPVPHGTNGGISLLGTCGAIAAAALIATTACATGFVQVAAGVKQPLSQFKLIIVGLILFAAGMAGTFVDSVLGATIEGKIPGVGKSAVNFACTLTGAIVAAISGFLIF